MSVERVAYAAVYYAVQRARGGVTRGMIEEARRVLESPRAEWEARALERLRSTHAGLRDWSSVDAVAPVERSALLERGAELARLHAGSRRVDVRRTSGSTGTPFQFAKDRLMTAWMDAAMWAVYAWHGVYPGAPHARFWGVPLQRGKRAKVQVSDRLLHRVRISAFNLTRDSVVEYFRALRRQRPVYAYGYPTLMKTFAELARAQGLDGRELGFRVVISTGEILPSALQSELAEFFGCRVMNEYGCTESGVLGMECERGTMHVVPVAAWPQVVTASGAQTVDGEEGEMVVSDLYGATLPLLRYRLHDRGTRGPATCGCGRELPSLALSSGRSDSFIRTPRGPVYDAILAYTVPPGIQRFKVYQTAPERLEAKVVPGVGFVQAQTPAECRRRWQDVLGPGMEIEVETVPDIPLEPSGKLRYFVPLQTNG